MVPGGRRLRGVTRTLLDPLRLRAAPDSAVAARLYRLQAPTYELLTAAATPWRERATAALGVRAGDTVVDVGCGSGLNLPHLQRRIGPSGRIVGVDLSAAMLARARRRVERAGWTNVRLVEATAEEASLPDGVDAVLLCAVHDVMRSPGALANVIGRLRGGGRVVAAGCKWAPWWSLQGVPLNLAAWAANAPFVTTFEGFAEPWSHLRELVPELRVEPVAAGCGYIAHGTVPPRRASRRTAQRRGGAPTEKL
jgi:ubiquinone/menaquinone biosynthesis C-methylase UbiE